MLYKFLEKQYLESFFKDGSLRIGTIYDFNDVISHTSARGDMQEGNHNLIRKIDTPFSFNKNTNEPIISDIFKSESDEFSTISNMSLVSQRASPDAFIFCTSKHFNDDLFRRWNEDCIKTNAVYAIIDPLAFFKEITEKIKTSVFGCVNSDIVYTSDPIPWNAPESKISPALTKERNKYSWQVENRQIWFPKSPSGKLNPFNIKVPNARRFCVPLAIYTNEKKVMFKQL